MGPFARALRESSGLKPARLVLDPDIQIVSNEAGEPTAVIVPIELWREIASERETSYLLKSETMKLRLMAAARRQDGLSL
jgi:hypothetical protein